MNFSTNQVLQFYVAGTGTEAPVVKPYGFEKAAKIVFPNYGLTSDKIENIMWAKVTTADALKKAIKKATLTMTEVVIPGENYVVRVSYPSIAGLGIEGWETKTAVYTAVTGDDAADVYEKLAETFETAFAADGALAVEATAAGLVITQVDHSDDYKEGIHPVVLPEFKVSFAPITKDGVEVDDWATVTVAETETYVSGDFAIADMEYFAAGEKGDEYRKMGYPNTVRTVYRVVPGTNYNVLNIHYAYKGANSDSHKSEKDLVIVAATEAALTAITTALKGIFTDLVVTEVTASGETIIEDPADDETTI